MKFGIIFANIGPAVQPDYAATLGQVAEAKYQKCAVRNTRFALSQPSTDA